MHGHPGDEFDGQQERQWRPRRDDLAGRVIAAETAAIQAVLRAEHLGQPAIVTAAYAVSVRALVALLVTLNEQVKSCKGR